MKLRNKKTGEIVELFGISCKGLRTFLQFKDNRGNFKFECNSLAELNEEWEDEPEEPKEYWWISPLDTDVVHCVEDVDDEMDKYNKQIGNYFETREEAEKAVEKLKAWKRLKEKGFRFTAWYGGSKDISFSIPQEIIDKTTAKDLDLLFGGEE